MKRIIVVALALTALLVAVTSAAAQDAPERGRDGAIQQLIEIASEQTGLSPREIAQGVAEGLTIADMATQNGGDPQAIIDAAYAATLRQIERAESNGRLTAERAQEMRENALARITQAVNGDLRAMAVEARARLGAARLVMELAIEQSGLNPHELRLSLREGATLGDLLTQNGVSLDAFVAVATERAQARLNVFVVDGRLTQERAAELLSEFSAALTERLNSPGGQAAGV